MKEEFYETSVGPERLRSQKVFYILYKVLFVIALIIFIGAVYFWLLTADTGFVIIMAFCLFFGAISFVLKRRLYLFYDYTYISGEVRVIKVINGRVRRRVIVFDAKDVKQVGKTTSESFKKLADTKSIRKIVATPNGLNASAQLYYVYAVINGQETLIVLECEEKLLAFIVSTRGKDIIEKDYK